MSYTPPTPEQLKEMAEFLRQKAIEKEQWKQKIMNRQYDMRRKDRHPVTLEN